MCCCVDGTDKLDDEHSKVDTGRHAVRSAHVLHDAVGQFGPTRLSGLRTGARASTPGIVSVCGLQPGCRRASVSTASQRVLCGASAVVVAWTGSVLSDAECDGWSNHRRYTASDEWSDATRPKRSADDLGAAGPAAQFLRWRDRPQSQLGQSGPASQSTTVSVDAVDRCQRHRPSLAVFLVALSVCRPDRMCICSAWYAGFALPFMTPFVRPLFFPLHDSLALIFPRRCGPRAAGIGKRTTSVPYHLYALCVVLRYSLQLMSSVSIHWR